jgi:hypothetical protein
MHIVLLGDSVFDNGAYVAGGRDVRSQLQQQLGSAGRATLLAVDGSVTRQVLDQTRKLPGDATHLVVSAGGNDALQQASILSERASSVAEVMVKMADVRDSFLRDYHTMLESLVGRGLPLIACTIYYPRFSDAMMQRMTTAALALFNDCILLEAFKAGVPLLDMRLICDEAADFANDIEPSAHGGAKMVRAILKAIETHDFTQGRIGVYQ